MAEKQLQAAKQNARLQAAQQAQGPPATLTAADTNGIFRSGSFSGIVRSSGSFSRPGLPRSGSLSINHSGSPTLAILLLSSQSSQSTKELSQQQGSSAAAHQQATSPSHSSKAYADVASKQTLLTEFATKIAQITCALSTLHSNVSKKISILYALFNNNVNHLYFVDVAAFADESMPPHAEDGAISNGLSNRSEYIMNILRKVV